MKIIDKEDELIDAFNILDMDGTGKISKYELRYIILSTKNGFNGNDIEELLKLADIDEDGNIDLHDFLKILMRQ